MKPILAVGVTTLSLALLTSCKSQAHTDRLNCEKLKVGMSETAVNEIMGPPHVRKEYPDGLSLDYGYELDKDGPVSAWLEDNGKGYAVLVLGCDGGGPDH